MFVTLQVLLWRKFWISFDLYQKLALPSADLAPRFILAAKLQCMNTCTVIPSTSTPLVSGVKMQGRFYCFGKNYINWFVLSNLGTEFIGLTQMTQLFWRGSVWTPYASNKYYKFLVHTRWLSKYIFSQ